MEPSSRDLHPRSGARFVFEREPGDELRYGVTIYLPERARWSGTLAWIDGAAELELEHEAPDLPSEQLTWARDETLKLARVLKRDPRPHMTRWRGGF